MLATARCAGWLLPVALIGATGCYQQSSGTTGTGSAVIAEGVLFSVEYERGDGTTGGFTRHSNPQTIPGSGGSYNVDAHGRLTNEYLIITYPQKKDLGPRVIPADRLVDVQFGDGGIKRIRVGEPPAE